MSKPLETGMQKNPESKDSREEEFLKARPSCRVRENKDFFKRRVREFLDYHKAQNVVWIHRFVRNR